LWLFLAAGTAGEGSGKRHVTVSGTPFWKI